MTRQIRHRSGKKGSSKSNQESGRLPSNAAPIEVAISHIGGRGDGVGKAYYTHNHKKT